MRDNVGYVVLTLKLQKEGSKWVGTCVELGTSTFARTLRQTIEELDALVIDHLNVLEQAGERERFFKRWDIKFYKTQPKPHKVRIDTVDADWRRFIQTALASHGRTPATHPHGPFYQPGVFPVSREREHTATLVEA